METADQKPLALPTMGSCFEHLSQVGTLFLPCNKTLVAARATEGSGIPKVAVKIAVVLQLYDLHEPAVNFD